MARIHPFRGLTYDPGKAGSGLDDLVSPPYDKIDADLGAELVRRSDHNIVRVIRPDLDPHVEDADERTGDGRHRRAAGLFHDWLADGVLREDEEPAIWAYHQTYPVPGGGDRTRRGFVALGELEDLGTGVRAHEQTHSGPKADRLALMKATSAAFGQIFMLYRDEQDAVNGTLEAAIKGRKPDLQAVDHQHVLHQAWRVTDPAVIHSVTDAMQDKGLIIADGHHRYETSLEYKEFCHAEGRTCDGAENPDNRMMTFVNLLDPGLTVFPGHRVVSDRDVPPWDEMAEAIGHRFDVREYRFRPDSEEDRGRQMTELLEDLRIEGQTRTAIGMVRDGDDRYRLLLLKGDAAEVVPGNGTDELKRLDVTVCTRLLLERALGVTPDDLDHERYVSYERHARVAAGRVHDGAAAAAFLLNPTPVEEVRLVTESGERMPQKSTDFHPKMITGLVSCRYRFTGHDAGGGE